MLRMLQLRFEFADGGKLLCWELLLPPQSRPRGIKSFFNVLKTGRRDFHGAAFQFKLVDWADSGEGKLIGDRNGWAWSLYEHREYLSVGERFGII